MRILALTKYDLLGASSRMRTYQYVSRLRQAGASVDLSPLLGDDYVSGLYSGRTAFGAVIKGYAHRIGAMLGAGRYDVVWIEKEVLPWLPFSVERLLLDRGGRIVVDYDDALFHRYDQHENPVVRAVLGKKIDRVMKRADLVLAGNEYLAKHARHAGASRVEWLPTVVDTDRYAGVRPKARENSDPIVVGWIGSPSTASYLRMVAEPFSNLTEGGFIKCIAIGANDSQLEGTPFGAVAWSESGEVELLKSLDVGIMPLPDAPWERGKCGYKLIQYMACGLPVVASPVGVNVDLVQTGSNGFLAGNSTEWHHAVLTLARSPYLREAMGLAGRNIVDSTYSLQVQAPRLYELLGSVLQGGTA